MDAFRGESVEQHHSTSSTVKRHTCCAGSPKLTRASLAVARLQKETGWSNAALVAGARDVGVSPAIAGSLEKGGTDLVEVRSVLVL